MADLGVRVHRRRLEPGGLLGRRLERAVRRDDRLFRERITPAWHHIDLVLPLAVVAVTALGVLMILSSTRGTDPGAYDFSYMRRQIAYSVAGLLLMVGITTFDYRRLRRLAWVPYAVVLGTLVLVLAIGTENRGSQSWFDFGAFQLQPAELAKVAVIVVLAGVLARPGRPLRARWMAIALVAVGPPVALILLQPDLGTALAFGAILLGMLLMAGARVRHLVILTALVLVGAVGVLTSDVLEDYQRERLTTFLDQDRNLGEQTYNLDQAKIAVGSGGAAGKGLFEGTQTRLGNVPEQHTDFIFAALGEELGFAGSATLLGLYALMAARIWRTSQTARDSFGMLLCIGVLSMLVFQIFQNIGMTVGLMPITGIPLPFMSYGGSSVLSAWLAVGLVVNVHMRRFR